MTRRLALVLYVISAFIFLRFAGLHVHLHPDAALHGGKELARVHFASGMQHSGTHVPDVDVDLLDASVVKKLGTDLDPLLFAVLILILLPTSRRVAAGPDRHEVPPPAAIHLLRPPPRAPPLPAS